MRTSVRLLRLGAVAPAAIAAGVLALVATGFLPDSLEVTAWGLWLATFVLLCWGVLEGPAARLLAGARPPKPGERALLAPAASLVGKAGLAAGRILVRHRASRGSLVEPIGRHTIVVDPCIVEGLFCRTLSVAEAAAAMAHASAALRVGPARFDVATRFWALPWTLVAGLGRRIIAALSSAPGGGLAWRLRFIVGGVAVVQAFQGGRPGIGMGVGVLVAVSYLGPVADRASRRIVERDADALVAATPLGGPLAIWVQHLHGAEALERVHRIGSAAVARQEVLPPAGTPDLARRAPRREPVDVEAHVPRTHGRPRQSAGSERDRRRLVGPGVRPADAAGRPGEDAVRRAAAIAVVDRWG